jgi:hypothetical protein
MAGLRYRLPQEFFDAKEFWASAGCVRHVWAAECCRPDVERDTAETGGLLAHTFTHEWENDLTRMELGGFNLFQPLAEAVAAFREFVTFGQDDEHRQAAGFATPTVPSHPSTKQVHALMQSSFLGSLV